MIRKIALIIFMFVIVFKFTLTNAYAQKLSSIWKIEIEGANGLKNTDWGPNGVSDPFADIYIYSTKGNHFNDKTPVAFNNINPQWHYIVKREYSPDEEISSAIFVIWDQDNMRNRFLGVAELKHPVPGQEYSLNLHRRRLLNTPTEPGKFLMPGTLKVRISVKKPLVRVPNIIGKTDIDARNELNSLGLKSAYGQVLVRNKNKVGRVVRQSPFAGKNVQLGQIVNYYIGRIPTYAVPNVVGYDIHTARRILRIFRHVKITYKAPSVDTPREKWMKIAEQSPKPGQGKITADEEINLVVLRPPRDFKIIIPEVVGDSPNDAASSLRDAKAPSIKWNKERTADKSKNNIVIAQSPLAGKEIPWNENNSVILNVGWYANGKSLYAAKPTDLDTPFNVTFDKPDSSEYRLVKITETGYLILKKIQVPENITPQSSYYGYDKSWYKVNSRRSYLPSAQRVTPGEWVVRVEPEMSASTNEKPCQFELNFMKEFDPAEPNDTFKQAVEISPNFEMAIGFIGGFDEDYYSFYIKKAGYLEVSFEPLASEFIDSKTERRLDLRYSLYNEQKKEMGSYYMPSANFLSPGRYYIDIRAGENLWNRMRYKFTLRFHEAQDVGEPNNTKDTAYEVQAGETIPVAYSMDDEDYYLIKSDKPGYAILSHDRDVPLDIDFYRYDSSGKVQDPMVYLPAAVRIDGERLVSLSPKTDVGKYVIDPPVNLQIGFIPANEDLYEPNDTPEQAAPIKLNQTIKGLLMPRFEYDNYSFIVNKSGRIFFDLIKPEGKDIPIKGKVLSSDGKTVIADRLDLPCEVGIKTPGKYILQFRQEPGLERLCEKQYKLTIRDGKSDEPGDRRTPSTRYGTNKNDKCIDLAKKAYQYLLNSGYKDANDLYDQALQCLPNNEVIWNDYGVSFFKLKQNEKAKEALLKAVSLNKKYALPYRNLAVIAWQEKDYTKGVDMAEKAVSLDPSDANLRYAAHAYIILSGNKKGEDQRKDLEKAAEYYRKIKNISDASSFNLNKIEKFLKGE